MGRNFVSGRVSVTSILLAGLTFPRRRQPCCS